MLRTAAISTLFIFIVACAGAGMKPYYSKSVVEPVVVKKLEGDAISLRYRVYPETAFYSKGVNYKVVDDALMVYIDRCAIREACSPMAETTIPLDNQWEAEVRIPYHGEKVMLIHADTEEQIYP